MSKSMKKHGQKDTFSKEKEKIRKNKYFGSGRGSEVLEQSRSSEVKILIWKKSEILMVQKIWREKVSRSSDEKVVLDVVQKIWWKVSRRFDQMI